MVGNPRTRVIDGDAHLPGWVAHGDPGRTAGIVVGVGQQIGQDLADSTLVESHPQVGVAVGIEGQVSPTRRLEQAAGEVHRVHQFQVDLGDTCLSPGDLQQIGDQLVEPVDLPLEQAQGLQSCLVFDPAPGHRQGCGHGGQRGAELMADVGSEAGLALDPVVELGDHEVERVDQRFEVGVAVGLQPLVQFTRPDGVGGVGHSTDRSQQATAGRPSGQRPQAGGTHDGHGQGLAQPPQRSRHV